MLLFQVRKIQENGILWIIWFSKKYSENCFSENDTFPNFLEKIQRRIFRKIFGKPNNFACNKRLFKFASLYSLYSFRSMQDVGAEPKNINAIKIFCDTKLFQVLYYKIDHHWIQFNWWAVQNSVTWNLSMHLWIYLEISDVQLQLRVRHRHNVKTKSDLRERF